MRIRVFFTEMGVCSVGFTAKPVSVILAGLVLITPYCCTADTYRAR